MTRKDFELIAAAINHPTNADVSAATDYTAGLRDGRRQMAWALADALAQTNPRFDRARFLKACGITAA